MAREPVNVEDELLDEQEEREEKRRKAFEQQQQIERLQAADQVEAEKNSPTEQLKGLAQDYAKDVVKTAAKEEAAALAAAAGSAIASSAPIWGPILAIVLFIIGMAIFVMISIVATCNQSGIKGSLVRWGSYFASYIPGVSVDVCAQLTVNDISNGGTSGGAGGGTEFPVNPKDPKDLVTLLGVVPVDSQTSDPRVRECMSTKVKQIFSQAQSQGIDITITSAFRSGNLTAQGTLSAHARGEAVDISLRNPTVAVHGSDPRIPKLVTIGKNVGFTGTPGDTLDEYTKPADNASGGHVHVEFNIPSNGGSYCAPFPT